MGKISGMLHKLWKENAALETEVEFKRRWMSVFVIYFTIFLMTLGFGITLTGVWPYLDKVCPDFLLKMFFMKRKIFDSWTRTLEKPFTES